MTPFLAFRRWYRRASSFERRSALGAAVVVLLLLVLAVRPTTGGEDSVATAGASGQSTASGVGAGPRTADGRNTSAPEAATDAGTADAVAASSPSATAGEGDAAQPATAAAGGTAAASTGGAAAPSCGPVASGTRGVTDKEIQIGFTLLDLAGPIGNSAVGAPPPDTQKRWIQAVADDINRNGGVRCRKLVVKTYSVNPLNQNEQQAICLQVAQDRDFALLDTAGFSYPATAKDCFARQGIPFVGQYGPLPAEERQYGKLMFSVDAPVGRMIQTSLSAMARNGFFDAGKGFQKLGLFVDDCGGPDLVDITYAALAKVGVDKAKVDKFEFDCPSSGFAPPNQVSQAVTQHKLHGVTHVLPITGSGSFSNYTKIAQQQNFHPKYTTIDYFGLPSTSETSGTGPDAQNFDGTIMATLARWGEYNTDMPPTPGAVRCSKQVAAAGIPAMSKANRNIGPVCNLLNLFTAMASKTPTLSQSTLGDGNASIGRFDAAYPSGDGIFDRPGKNSGGDFYRYIQWHADCYCWKVVEPGGPFHPAS